jgi:hypothetical protein
MGIMKQVGDWHQFDPNNPGTYPKVAAPVQVLYMDGRLVEGFSYYIFPRGIALPDLPSKSWRYIKDRTLS